MFLSLIKVTGIGPKSALAILASSTPHEVKLAIENENDAYLTQFPDRKENCKTNCVRFKRKVTITEENSDDLLQTQVNGNEQNQIISEALLALQALGYSKRELTKVEKSLNKHNVNSVDEAVKIGLQTLVS